MDSSVGADPQLMRLPIQFPKGGVLNELASTYSKARVFLGAGLIVLAGILIATGASLTWIWPLPVAGAAILAHVVAMKAWGMLDTTTALLVDLVTMLLVSLALTEPGDHAVSLLTMVGACVIIALFTHGWVQYAIVAFVATFTFLTLAVAENWDLSAVVGDFLGASLVAGLAIGVITSIRRRLLEVEMARAQTLGVVSHELRNHLTGIIGITELVKDHDVGLRLGELEELLGMAHDQAVDASMVIEDLLIASRAERGALDAIPEIVDLVPLTKIVIRHTAVEGHVVTCDDLGGRAWALADPLRYKQILRNLLTNAARYGGPHIRVALTSMGDYVSIVVSDDGLGVKPGEESLVFEPYRVGSESRRVPGSAGLGLWIARRLAQRMNGDLTYRRMSDQTIFEVTLPSYDMGDRAAARSDENAGARVGT